MFGPDNEDYVLRHLSSANLMLFLGAGFSSLAQNRLGEPLPVVNALAKSICEFWGFDVTYSDDGLDDMYEAMLGSGRPHAEIRNFLEQHLLCRDIPALYGSLVDPFWYRIYTTNVDDLLPRVYLKATTKLNVLSYPNDDVS